MSAVKDALRKRKRAPTFWERVQAGGANVVRGAKQVAAGALETTIAPTAAGSMRPAIVDAIPGTVGLVATLLGRKAPSIPGVVDTQKSMDRLAYAAQHTNRYLGTTDPRNAAEMALRVGGSLIIPGPKTGIVRAAPKSASRTQKLARGTARVATELAVPLRQTGVKGSSAVVGIGTGLREGIDAIAPSDDYTSIAETVGGTTPEAAEFVPDDFDNMMASAITEDGDDFDLAMATPILDDAEIDATEEDEKQSGWVNATLALGAAVTGGVAVKYGRGLMKQRIEEATRPEFIGKTVKRSRGGRLDKFVGAVAQQDRAVRTAAEDFLSPQQAKQYGYKSDLANNVSIGARLSNQFTTGRMVGVPPTANGQVRKTVPLVPVAQAYAKELSLDEQRLVGDALLAASALDDFRSTGVLSALNKDKAGNPMTARDLDDLVRSTRSNPKYAKYMEAVQKSYADILEYRVARGTMSREAADAMRAKRPNYVAFNRDVDTDVPINSERAYNANMDRGGGVARSTEELAGVQGGAVGNPFNTLFDDWASEVRRAELNDLRATFLEQMDSVAGNGIVRRIPNGVKPNTREGLHTVWRNGKEESFFVADPAISKALEYSPRATIKGLEVLRQVSQNFTTGPIGTLFNAFAITKSTLYDTTLGTLLRPDNVKLGNINEILGNINPRLSIGRADPTAYLGAFTGAARYMWDDLRGAMASNLSDQLIREHSWLRGAIGDNNVTALRDRLASSYEASVKSFMDEHGITSLTMHGSPDPSRILTGVEQLAPKFATDTAQQLYDEVRRNGPTAMEGLLAAGTNTYAKAKASSIARAYNGVLEAMHNGFRYSAVAANRSRNKNVEQLASQMRRLSADAAQHGGNDTVNKVMGSLMYANLSVQTLHQTAMAIRANPTGFLANLAGVGMTAAALHYTALATDPEAAERHKLKSAAQKASSLTTFGGAEIPIDPLLRIPIGNAFAVLDHATGAHDGNWDGNMLQALNNILSGEFNTPEYQTDAMEILWQTAKANNPLAPEGSPLVTGALAYAGVDPGMSRITGETMPVRTQGLSGFGADASQVDGMGSAYAENIIASIFGSAGDNLWRIADDASRAYGDTNSVGMAVAQGLSRYKDTAVKGSGVFKPLLFGDYEQTYSVTDTNWQMMKARSTGIDASIAVLNKDVRAVGASSVGRTGDMLPTDAMTPPPEIRGTQLEVITENSLSLNNILTKFKANLSSLGKQVEATRGFYTTPQEQKNKQVNELNEQRRYITWQMLNVTRQYEQEIGQRIGDPHFSFEDFDPEQYMKPVAPPQ